MIIRGKHIGSRLAWTVQRKFNPQFEDKDKRVEGLAIFHEWFRDHHILVSRTAEEYINGIFPRDRAIIAYTQNLMMWLALIRFEIITFFGKIEWISVATANPFIFLDRGDLAAQTLAFLCAMGAFFGKLSSFEKLTIMKRLRLIFIKVHSCSTSRTPELNSSLTYFANWNSMKHWNWYRDTGLCSRGEPSSSQFTLSTWSTRSLMHCIWH